MGAYHFSILTVDGGSWLGELIEEECQLYKFVEFVQVGRLSVSRCEPPTFSRGA